MTSKGYSKETIKNASEVSIVDYVDVTGIGEFTYRKGHQYRLSINGSDSVVVDTRKNMFFHNAVNESGNIITFIRHFEGLSFQEAVKKLLEFRREGKVSLQKESVEVKKEPFVYSIEHNPTTYRAKNYLIKERGIDSELVEQLIKEGYIHEDKYGNVIFDWIDSGLKEGKRVGATKQATVQRFDDNGNPLPKKYIEKNSELFGFNVTLGTPKELYVFEAPIDLLSYWTLNKDLKNVRLVSMDGVKQNVLKAFMENTKEYFGSLPRHLYIGTDNDKAGTLFYEETQKLFSIMGYQVETIIPERYELLDKLYPIYESVSQEYQVDKNLLIAIHKHENGGQLNNRSYHKESTGYFTTKDDKDNEGYSSKEFEKKLITLAKDIQGKDVPTALQDLFIKGSTSKEESIKYANRSSVENLYTYYSTNEHKVVLTFQKDWNDMLLHKPKTLKPRTEKRIKFQYPYQETDKEAIRDFYYKKYIAPEIVEHLMDKRLLRSTPEGNPVFVFNRYKETIGALEWNEKTREYQRLENSLPSNTFSVSLGNPESVIAFKEINQLLEFWTLHKGVLNHTHLVSLDTLSKEEKQQCIQDRINLLPNINVVYFCSEKTDEGKQFLIDFEELRENDKKGILKVLYPVLTTTWENELKKTRTDFLEKSQQKTMQKEYDRSL